MDTRTGEIYELPQGVTMDQFAESLAKLDRLNRSAEQIRADMIRIDKRPDPSCSKCKGRGYVKKGLNSRRFKPCSCVIYPKGIAAI